MNPIDLFINTQTKLLRSGWRALFFIALALSPYLLAPLFLRAGEPGQSAVFDFGLGMAVVYALLIGWLVFVSWFCLWLLDRLGLAALGFAPHSGWSRDVMKGFAVSAAMIAAIVGLQMLGGGTQVKFNLEFSPAAVADVVAALLIFTLAAAVEELAFRGYAFQTLLRGAPAAVPIVLFSVFFAFGHWENPNRTFFSTANTVLAGIWLSIAYYRTRSLWFPTALHVGWNWTMGAFFGLPVSGLLMPRQTILLSSSGAPVWLTGGSYGCEGGAAATVVMILGIVVLWRARWLGVSPEMNAALTQSAPKRDALIDLGLNRDEN